MAQSQHQPLSFTLYTQFNHQVLSFLPSKVFPNLAILIQVTITPSLADSHTLHRSASDFTSAADPTSIILHSAGSRWSLQRVCLITVANRILQWLPSALRFIRLDAQSDIQAFYDLSHSFTSLTKLKQYWTAEVSPLLSVMDEIVPSSNSYVASLTYDGIVDRSFNVVIKAKWGHKGGVLIQ